jgi:hypothetical protein
MMLQQSFIYLFTPGRKAQRTTSPRDKIGAAISFRAGLSQEIGLALSWS